MRMITASFAFALIAGAAWGQNTGSTPEGTIERWVAFRSNPDRRTLFRGGTDLSGNAIYVCRASHQGGIHPGKYVPGVRSCSIEYAGVEVLLTDFEVLTQMAGTWIPTSGSTIPAGALAVGRETQGTLYSCRAYVEGGIEVGKTRTEFNACNISLNGRAYTPSKYEVLAKPWTPSAGGDTANKLKAGNDSLPGLQPFYVCRGAYNGGVHIGKFSAREGCTIGYADWSVKLEQFEVLTSRLAGQWVAASNGEFPSSAVQGGNEPAVFDYAPQYVCRVTMNGGVHPGKLPVGLGGCQIALNQNGQASQATVKNYEVLVATPALEPGPYRIRTQATGKFWVEGANLLVSTRTQDDSTFARFTLSAQSDGTYRIVVQGDHKFLHEDGSGDKLISTRYQPDDDFARFWFEQANDGSYRLRVKADNRYVENANDDQTLSTRAAVDSSAARFYLDPVVPSSSVQPVVSDFSATPRAIGVGGTARLSWAVTGANVVLLDGVGYVPPNASITVSPSATTTYRLTASNRAGTVVALATVTVDPRPVIVFFSQSPVYLRPGAFQSTLVWVTTGATSVRIDPAPGAVALSGAYPVAPKTPTVYTLSASNAAGTVTRTVTVDLVTFANLPVIAKGGVVTVSAAAARISPLSLVSIYGYGFMTGAAQTWDGKTLLTTLAGVSVKVDGKPAYLLYAGPEQINIQVPDTATRGQVAVVVTNGYASSDPVMVEMASIAPEFKGWGTSAYVEATRPGPTSSCPNVSCPVAPPSVGLAGAAPAKPGESASLWGFGFGPSNPPAAAGTIAPVAPLANPVQVTIGGVAATVPYGGFVQGVGLYQVDVIVPDSLPDGDHDVVATVGGVRTLKVMKLSVKR